MKALIVVLMFVSVSAYARPKVIPLPEPTDPIRWYCLDVSGPDCPPWPPLPYY